MAGQPRRDRPELPAGHPMPGHAWHPGTADGPERPEHGAMARYRRLPEPAQFSRLLGCPQARGKNALAPTWKRFQDSGLPAGTSTLPGGDLPAESLPEPGAGPAPGRRVTIADVAADAGVGVGYKQALAAAGIRVEPA